MTVHPRDIRAMPDVDQHHRIRNLEIGDTVSHVDKPGMEFEVIRVEHSGPATTIVDLLELDAKQPRRHYGIDARVLRRHA